MMNCSEFPGRRIIGKITSLPAGGSKLSESHAIPPGQSQGRLHRPRRYTFNLVVTGRCNTGCTYCHYYEHRNRRAVWYDLPDDQYDNYLRTIAVWQTVVPGVASVRFSGGDPIVLGDRIFDLAEKCYGVTGISPFMLTAGKSMSRS